MKAKEITYERVKSYDYNNEKVGVVLEVEENENTDDVFEEAKRMVAKQFGELPVSYKTPAEIVEEIKSICQKYYPSFMSSSQDKEEMTKLLNELKEMAEGNK